MMTERIGITKKIEKIKKEHPILFSDPMVRAILDGKKTQTRRIVKLENFDGTDPVYETGNGDLVDVLTLCPYGQPGDSLWVRESWQYYDWTEDGIPYIKYRADDQILLREPNTDEWQEKVGEIWADLSLPENYKIDNRASDRRWRVPRFMPRWASRITLEVTGVRVERLQDISFDDAIAEGTFQWAGFDDEHGIRSEGPKLYRKLWESINGPGSWDKNPWVLVIEFKGVIE